jgi:dTDP-4-amino-4,6-dideoxygalactose transaminase
VPDGHRSAWAQYAIETPERDALKAHLQANGIPSVIYYVKPLHQQVAYEQILEARRRTGVSEALPSRILCLPMHPYLTEADQERIVGSVAAFFAAGSDRAAAE